MRRSTILAYLLGTAVLAASGVPCALGRRPDTAAAPSEGAPGVDPRGDTIGTRFPPPRGLSRGPLEPASFAGFLRSLPLTPDGAPVRLFDGTLKRRQDVHAAVVAMDLGPRDLQQCADSVLRLRAEHLFAAGRAQEISFHFTSGFSCSFRRWAAGERPRVRGNLVAWEDGAPPDRSAASLRRYLDVVYTYAGTRSLPMDLGRVAAGAPVEIGDVYLQPGSPGHAMIVVDAAQADGTQAILLAQGYMPAQEIHVVRNLAEPESSPWFVVGRGRTLSTPEWTFAWGDRWRFPEPR